MVNGCKDNAPDLVKNFSKTINPNVKLIELTRPSKSKAVRRGILQSTGDICCFIDDDISKNFHDIPSVMQDLVNMFNYIK